ELEQARPGYGFLGEEGGAREGSDKTHRWIVDPLDGTLNFLHGIPHFAISIGLEREGTIVAGLVYNPVTDELFTAERGKGAFLNDQRLRVAARKRLDEAVVACALPHPSRGDVELTRSEHAAVQERVAGLRRFGAAALDLAWVAAGRLDAYWERGLSPWDMAAGIALVREAGGFVTDLDGRDDMIKTGGILAAGEDIHRQMLRALKEAPKALTLPPRSSARPAPPRSRGAAVPILPSPRISTSQAARLYAAAPPLLDRQADAGRARRAVASCSDFSKSGLDAGPEMSCRQPSFFLPPRPCRI